MNLQRRKGILNNILEAVGDTPLVRLSRVAAGAAGNVLVKCEYLNPSGSIKDRMALQMVEEAEHAGRIQPGVSTLVESSSGNTAQALSMVGAVKGYRVKIYFPEATGVPEKIRALQRYGTELELTRMDDADAQRVAQDAGLHGATIEIPGRLRCLNEEQSTPDILWIRQFSNPANSRGQSQIAQEILEQTDGKVDVFVASIGTGGTFLGIAQVLKHALPHVKCIALEPTGWEGWSDPLAPTTKYVPGITGGIAQEIRDSGIADEIVNLGNEEARTMAYRLSREEGLICGISSGANVYIALAEACRPDMRGKNVVTVLVDRADRYLSDERFIT